MRKLIAIAFALVAAGASASAAVIPVQTKGGDIAVTATYKGKGTVDDKHEILVFLFDHPNPTGDSRPLGVEIVTKNGQTVTFKGVMAEAVYITAVYDEQSNYDGKSAPPVGAPIATYGKGGKPVSVKPGPTTKVALTFDGTRRWK